ncbi:MAG: hypothetical protein ACJA13_003450, partial [Paraglaciecola sp.]
VTLFYPTILPLNILEVYIEETSMCSLQSFSPLIRGGKL